MAGLKQIGTGDKINTPHLRKMLLEDVKQELANGDDEKYKSDFQDKMTYPCGVCLGSGLDPDEKVPCYGCEGKGIDYEITFGMNDGKMFAYTTQYGLDFFKEMCKAHREAEAEMTLRQRSERMGVVRFKLPAVIDMELQARGFTPEDIRGGGERRQEVVKVVQTEFPDLMCSSYTF